MQKNLKRLDIILVLLIIVLIVLINFQSSKEDTVPPDISFSTQELTVSVKDGNEALLVGVSAVDDEDGDVSDSLVVENISDFDENGTRTVTYAAFDSSKNIKFAKRKIKYSDYVSPRFYLTGSTTFSSSDSKMSIADIVGANDVFDGDISSFIKLNDSDVVVGQSGEYSVTLSVYNSAGDCSTLTLPVSIEPSVAQKNDMPVITLTNYLVYLKKGDKKPDWKSYVSTVEDSPNNRLSQSESEDGPANLKVSVQDSEVDMSKEGCYCVTFQTVNSKDITGTAKLIVVVE